MKATGLVFKSRDYIGSVQPPATVLEDESRWGNNGTFKADGEPDWVQLPSGLWVQDFDGSDDEIALGNAAILSFASGGITLMTWASIVATIRRQTFIGKAPGYNPNYRFHIDTEEKLAFSYRNAANTDTHTYTATEATGVGVWHHFAVSFTYGTGSSMVLYVDGAAIAGAWVGTGDDLPQENIGETYIGFMSADRFENLMVKQRIYKYALSAADIAALFQSGRHWFGV
ncbi:hypothetical protein ES703_33357 [subsurface metagenome]